MIKTKENRNAEDIAGRGNLAASLGIEVLNAKTDNPFRIFKSDKFGSVRTATMQGKHYFAATDVAVALGYKVPEKAIRTHCKGVSVLDTPTDGGIQPVNYISEPDLYRLVIRSKLPAAEDFADWVFEDVLPAINRTGVYVKATQPTPQTQLQTAAQFIDQIIDDPIAYTMLSNKIAARIKPSIVTDIALQASREALLINTTRLNKIDHDVERMVRNQLDLSRQIDDLSLQIRELKKPAKNYRIVAVEAI